MKTLDKKKSVKGTIARYAFAFLFISSWAVLGIALALTSAKLDIGGQITFMATDIYAEITGKVEGTTADKTLSTISFDSSTTSFTTPDDWKNINLTFGENSREITVTITIKNKAERKLYLAFEDNITATNIGITRKQGTTTLPTNTKFTDIAINEGSETTPQVQILEIKLNVTDPNLSATGKFELNINLSNELVKATTEYQDLTFTPNSDGTMTIGRKSSTVFPTGDLVIPAQVKDENGKICNVTKFALYAFFNSGITSVRIPSTVTNINTGGVPFGWCDELEVITVDGNNPTYYSYENGIYIKNGTELVAGCKTTKIKDGTKTIGIWAFYGQTTIINIDLPESVTKIKKGAFIECTKLQSITIPKNVAEIDESAFSMCYLLKTVYIDSNDISSALTSATACGSLIENANTIYLATGCTAGSYITSNFSTATSDKTGYVKYVKNS